MEGNEALADLPATIQDAANAKNNNIQQHAYVTSYPIARQQHKQRSKRSGNSREAVSVEQSFEQ